MEPMSKKRTLKQQATQLLAEDGLDLKSMAARVLEALQSNQPEFVEGLDPALHYLPPCVNRDVWQALGTLVIQREKAAAGSVDGSKWISLRLDGSSFSRTVQCMRKSGLLDTQAGFSYRFAECMRSCLKGLMEKFSAKIGYTQSDEMVVFIPPTNVIRGERQPHFRNGRVTKLTTLASGFVSSCFVSQLAQIYVQTAGQGQDVDQQELVGLLAKLSALAPHFDCRLGAYDSWEECRALLLWRAYDCSVNGVSDAVHQLAAPGAGRKRLQQLGRRAKLQWLHARGLLPLPDHQAYGVYLARMKRRHEGHNPIQNTTVQTLGPVLELARVAKLVPEDETVKSDGTGT